MAEVTRHNPGTFSWAELATTDAAAAKKFYTSLFGWGVDESPFGSGPDDIYTRLQISGKDVGALYPMRPEQRQQGVPPNWLPYVTVAKADDAAQKAKSLGGKLLMEPFDVMSYGRMAVLQDPSGGTLAIWEPREHIGAQKVNESGAFCWMELLTRDAEKARKFYSDLFGWTMKPSANDPKYTEIWRGAEPIGGLMGITPEMGNMPSNWSVYWMVTDVDASAAKAKSLGGSVMMGPQDIPTVGRFAALKDPQGAIFSIFKPAPRERDQ
jgi:uncharacterized protein